MKYFFGIFLLIISLISHPLYSDAYDDCIIKNMKGVTSDSAANAIARACYNKHKKNEKKSNETQYYYKEICTTYNANLDMGDLVWDDNYIQNVIVPVTNKSTHRAWVKFYYAKPGSTDDKDFIQAGSGVNIEPSSTNVLKIRVDDIIYSERFTYKVKGSYEICKNHKVQKN